MRDHSTPYVTLARQAKQPPNTVYHSYTTLYIASPSYTTVLHHVVAVTDSGGDVGAMAATVVVMVVAAAGVVVSGDNPLAALAKALQRQRRSGQTERSESKLRQRRPRWHTQRGR